MFKATQSPSPLGQTHTLPLILVLPLLVVPLLPFSQSLLKFLVRLLALVVTRVIIRTVSSINIHCFAMLTHSILACDTQVNVSMSFGGPSWSISPNDFKLTQVSQSQCVGAFFEMQTGSSAPAWIVGDTFLVCIHYPNIFACVETHSSLIEKRILGFPLQPPIHWIRRSL